MINEFKLMPLKSFSLLYTPVYLKLSLQDAVGVLRNVIMKTSLVKDPLKTGYIHLVNRLKFRKFTLDHDRN